MKKTRMSLSELNSLNNTQLHAYIRAVSSDTRAADLLKQRWQDFWEKDHHVLQEQRGEITRKGIEIERLKSRVKELEKEVLRLQQRDSPEIFNLKQANDLLRTQLKYAEQQMTRLRLQIPPWPRGREFVPIIPSFTVPEWPGRPTNPCEIARMARVLSN